MSEARKTMVD
jgi:hypothetical protein